MNDTLKARTQVIKLIIQEGLSIGLAINFQYILNNNVTEIISLNSKYGEVNLFSTIGLIQICLHQDC